MAEWFALDLRPNSHCERGLEPHWEYIRFKQLGSILIGGCMDSMCTEMLNNCYVQQVLKTFATTPTYTGE